MDLTKIKNMTLDQLTERITQLATEIEQRREEITQLRLRRHLINMQEATDGSR